MTRPRIAIVGGGLAGLSAAVELAKGTRPWDIVLFEARHATGGRAGSFVDPQSGELVDYCQHVAMGCCTQFLQLMRDAGLEGQFDRYCELNFMSQNSPPIIFRKPRILPAPLHLLPFFVRLPNLSLVQKASVALAMLYLLRASPESLRTVSAATWLAKHRQTTAAIERFWDVVVASALGDTCQRVSMRAVRKVFVDGFLASHSASDLYVPKQPLRQLIADQLTAYVRSHCVDVRLGHPVKAIEYATNSNGSVRLLIDDRWETFHAIILATPAHAMAKLLKTFPETSIAQLAAKLEQVPYSPITGVHLWFDRPVMPMPHAVFLGTMIQWAFRNASIDAKHPWPPIESNRHLPREHYLQVVISASHDLRKRDHAEVIAQVQKELEGFFPEATTAKLLRAKVVTDPLAVYSLSPEVDAIRPSNITSCPFLFLSGDFTQTHWPATMEGAVISGQAAARLVRHNLAPHS